MCDSVHIKACLCLGAFHSMYMLLMSVLRSVCRYDREEEVRSNKKGRGCETGVGREGVKRGFWMKQIGIF